MILGILSDTHEHIENIERAKHVFAERNASPIIHLGDYCAGPSVRALAGTKIIGILGNNDGDPLRIEHNFKQIGGDFRWEFCVLEFDGLKIACYHGTVPEITEALITCKKYNVVLSGHTHEPSLTERDGVLALNPGSAHGFENAATVAILDTKTKKAEIIELQ
ncbi:MAG: metallophosphoesterase [Candidatus Peregrinibacteria bacterium]|nr:metallophosphoesterase [Candidatus Peregrinibacteria bacterium]